MARFHKTSLILLVALFSLQFALSVVPPENSPAPAPELESGDSSAISRPPSSPSPSPEFSSPPAPPPSDLAPVSSPTPSPALSEKTPVPAPSAEISHENVDADDDVAKDSSSSGMTSGQKAGIAIGVIAGACIVGFGGILYKKRQQNIRRSEYGYAARREIL